MLWRWFIRVIIVLSLVLAVIPVPVVYETGNYRTPITITEQSGNDLTDYQVKIVLDSTWDGWNNLATTNGSDIYFLDSSNNPLYYWIEEFDYSNQEATIWVKVPSIPASSSVTIYMYYGEDNPYSSYNDPSKVFLFYDDFETWSGWIRFDNDNDDLGNVVQDTARVYEGQYSAHKIEDNDPDGAYKSIGITIGRNIALEFWINRNSNYAGGAWDQILIVNDDGKGYNWAFDHSGDTITARRRDGYSSVTDIASTSTTDYMDKWVFAQLIILSDGRIIARRYVDGELSGEAIGTDSTYSSFTRVHIGGGYDYWIDQIKIRKYVDPEPSVSIGSSEAVGGGGVYIKRVSPSSIYAGTGDSISINVTLNNTYSYDVDVTVKLIDHDSIVRDEVNVTVPANSTYNVSLLTVLTENDIGDHTWTISVYNASDNSLLDSCSISVSVFNRTIEITAVDPSSISGEPNDTVTVNVTVKSTLLWTVTVNISLIDHNDVVRDYVETAIDPDQVLTVSLSTTLAEEDRGEWVWRVRVYNETTTFSSHSLNASIHYNLSYTFSYTLDFSLAYNVSEVIASRFNYTLQPLSSLNVSEVETYTPYPMIWGTKYCLDLYTNNTGDWSLEYHECGAYVYVLYINIYYIIESSYPDLVYDYISIRDNDTDQIVTYMYIPHGNTSRTVFSDKYYTLEIPLNGTTPHGYKYELVKYVVDGVENPDIIYVDSDKTIDIYFRIYEEETGGNGGENGGDGGGGDGGDSTPPQETFSPPPPVSFGEVDVSGVLPPVFSVGSPSLYSPHGILVLAFFIGLFIVYSRELSWGQALVLASGLSMIISVILVGITLVPLFMVLFIVGIGMWKILGK